MLGLHKIQRVPFQYQLAPTLDSAHLLLHIAAVLAASLAVAASMRIGNWVGRVLAAAAVMQAVTGVLMYLGATGDAGPRAPGLLSTPRLPTSWQPRRPWRISKRVEFRRS